MSIEEIVSVDGTITPTAEAVIPLKDDGLYRGDGVFEVVRLYGGRPFAMQEHLDRIERSAAQIELPVDRAAVERESSALIETHGDDDAQLRIVLTRGGRRIAAIEPIPEMAPSVSLATVRYSPSIILTGAKTLSYGANMQATRLAAAQGADEAVLVRPDGVVLEPPTSTIFWATETGGLRTPALDAGILDSITRRKLLEVLDDVEEGEFQLDDLLGATEAFLASSVREVQPVGSIDGTELDRHGSQTQRARAVFDGMISDWLASDG
jgi:branched-chain amino acid aminotransferase